MTYSRRRFLQTAATATGICPYVGSSSYARSPDKSSRLRLAMIGCGGKGRDDAQLAAEYGDFVAVCDVDRRRAETYAGNPALSGNGRRKLDILISHSGPSMRWVPDRSRSKAAAFTTCATIASIQRSRFVEPCGSPMVPRWFSKTVAGRPTVFCWRATGNESSSTEGSWSAT